jgi:hypothetical protein
VGPPTGVGPRSHQLTLQATGAGVTAQSAALALTVATDSGSFALSLSPMVRSLPQWRCDSVIVRVARAWPFTGAVALAVTGLPPGITAKFTPASIRAGSTTSMLTLDLGPGAAPGNLYLLTVYASGAGVTTQTETHTLSIAR